MGLFNIIGSIVGGRAADKASDRMADALTSAGQSLEAGGKEYESRIKPISGIAPTAIQRLQDILLGGDMSKFYESPDYKYRLTSGRDAIEGGAAGRKMLMSGRTLKELERFRQQEASGEFGNALSRIGELFGMADPYYQTYAGLPYTMAADKANIQSNIGQVKSQGILGKAAATQNMLAGIESDMNNAGEAYATGGSGGAFKSFFGWGK